MTINDWQCLVISGSDTRVIAFYQRLPRPWPWREPVTYRAVWGEKTGKPPAFVGPVGAWGCWRTHVRIWEDVLSRGLPGAIVFEDDCTFASPATWVAAATGFLEHIPPEWDMAYLGGQHLAPATAVCHDLLRGVNVNRTHAYLVRNTLRTQAAYWRLCEMKPAPNCRPHLDYVLGEMQKTGQLTAYCPPKWLCGQSAGVSTITGKETAERYF